MQRAPAFRFLWSTTGTAASEAILAAGRHDAPAVVDAMIRLRDTAWKGGGYQKLQTSLQNTANAMLAFTASRLQASLAMDAGELNVLTVTALRDLGQRILAPDWRLKLSYRQLVQTRAWAARLTSAAGRAFATNLCAVENMLTVSAQDAIDAKGGYQAWQDHIIQTLAREGRSLRPRGRDVVLARAAWMEKFTEVIESMTRQPYTAVVRQGA